MGESIQQVRNQLNEYWQELDKTKKTKLIIIGIIAILTIIILSIVFTRTKYDVLYQDLSLKDTSQITKKLDEMGVEWKTSGNDTTTILVPTEMKNKIKIELASYGLPKEGYSFIDAFNDSSWTMTDYDKKERMKLALQSELSSTISDIEGIEKATVYINEKEDSGFVLEENNQENTASVFIEKSDNKALKGETVTAIQNLVAGSINMEPEKVQIVDSEGKLLSGEQDESELLMTDQFNIKNNLELRINDSIKNFLENVFGAGNVDVRSSIKINFDSERTT
ncbi:flagellar basal-body MS-ring/collar protein FliF, partial [Schnuerera sp.]|uniref:flagellar basal-body MS-ring/collar protein FliF n=1 Tax=Schnuerera sp. TaxID=2794844 RepID=UPI002CE41535